MSRKVKVKIMSSPEQYFSLCTGSLIKDQRELAFTLDYLSDEEFSHHVNEHKNDFSSWAKEVFGEVRLAENLLKTQDKQETQIILLKHLI